MSPGSTTGFDPDLPLYSFCSRTHLTAQKFACIWVERGEIMVAYTPGSAYILESARTLPPSRSPPQIPIGFKHEIAS